VCGDRRDLSIPAQRNAVEAYATQHGAAISMEYVEAGSGRDSHRLAFRQMLGDVLAASDVSVALRRSPPLSPSTAGRLREPPRLGAELMRARRYPRGSCGRSPNDAAYEHVLRRFSWPFSVQPTENEK
jgi:hypothetical protein